MGTTIYLINTPLINNEHTFYFETKEKQQLHFMTNSFKQLDNYNYQRKDGFIRVNAYIDDIIKCNYVMYQNTDYSNKWYYAFVKDIKYHNDEYTDLYIETDVIQTWMFNYTIGESFIDREHVKDDTIGLHTQPEGLELGEYIAESMPLTPYMVFDKSNCCGVLAVSELIPGLVDKRKNYEIPNGFKYVACSSFKGLEQLIEYYDSLGKGEAIQYIFVAPKMFFSEWLTYTIVASDIQFDGTYSTCVNYEMNDTFTISRPNTLGHNYYPTNKKLLTYPFSFLQVSNNTGGVADYKWEYFRYKESDQNERPIEFRIKGTICPGCSIVAIPQDYKKISDNRDEAIPLGKLPIGCWTSDVYTNWLTQNSVNLAIDKVSSLVSIIGGSALMFTGAGTMIGGGMVAGGLMSIGKNLSQQHEYKTFPDQAKVNGNTVDINYQFGYDNFTCKKLSVSDEYAKIIDDFFNMYGYKINRVKIPEKNHRTNYWYTKTIDANIKGNIPRNDLLKIIEAYNNGITFWKQPYNFRNYSVVNDIV